MSIFHEVGQVTAAGETTVTVYVTESGVVMDRSIFVNNTMSPTETKQLAELLADVAGNHAELLKVIADMETAKGEIDNRAEAALRAVMTQGHSAVGDIMRASRAVDGA